MPQAVNPNLAIFIGATAGALLGFYYSHQIEENSRVQRAVARQEELARLRAQQQSDTSSSNSMQEAEEGKFK
eukprot:jgi/Chlat1/4203/Chrsp27S08880